MSEMEKLLVFTLSDLRCALHLAEIDRILPAIAITPIPKAPEIVMGLINVQGRVIPVLNIRQLLRLPVHEMTLNDRIIMTRTAHRVLAILVDTVSGVAEFREQDVLAPGELYPGIPYLQGVTKLHDGIIYIYNLDRFLSSTEKAEIDQILTGDIPMPATRNL